MVWFWFGSKVTLYFPGRNLEAIGEDEEAVVSLRVASTPVQSIRIVAKGAEALANVIIHRLSSARSPPSTHEQLELWSMPGHQRRALTSSDDDLITSTWLYPPSNAMCLKDLHSMLLNRAMNIAHRVTVHSITSRGRSMFGCHLALDVKAPACRERQVACKHLACPDRVLSRRLLLRCPPRLISSSSSSSSLLFDSGLDLLEPSLFTGATLPDFRESAVMGSFLFLTLLSQTPSLCFPLGSLLRLFPALCCVSEETCQFRSYWRFRLITSSYI